MVGSGRGNRPGTRGRTTWPSTCVGRGLAATTRAYFGMLAMPRMVFNAKVALVGMVPDARHCLHAGSRGYWKDSQTPQLVLHDSTLRLLPCPGRITPCIEFSRKT
jgi:hypothetical protein